MKAAGLDEIFSPEKVTMITTTPAEQDIFSAAAAPVRKAAADDDRTVAGASAAAGGASAEEEESVLLNNFEQESQPVQKTRREVIADGIDRTPMLSVAQIKEKFNKGNAPVFPKLPAPRKQRKDKQSSSSSSPSSAASPKQQQIETPASPPAATAADALAAAKGDSSPKSPAEAARALATVDEEAAERPSDESAALRDINVESLTQEEFLKIAALQGCKDAIDFYSEARSVAIVIKPETPAGDSVLVKHMELKYNPEQRLLVMVRKNATRYIRLNDVTRIVATADALSFVSPAKLPPGLEGKFPVALYFSTTKYPMVIIVDSPQQKDQLMRLVIFLRQLLKTEAPLEVSA